MKKASKKMVTAASWDAVWGAYCKANKAGDAEALSAAKGNLRCWYSQAGQSIPAWAW